MLDDPALGSLLSTVLALFESSMFANQVKSKLSNGGVVCGVMCMEFGTPGMPAISAAAGCRIHPFRYGTHGLGT